MAAYHEVDGLKSPVDWLPVHRDQLRAQRLVMSMGKLNLYLTTDTANMIDLTLLTQATTLCWNMFL